MRRLIVILGTSAVLLFSAPTAFAQANVSRFRRQHAQRHWAGTNAQPAPQ